jgi:cytochrome c oxidase subunit II
LESSYRFIGVLAVQKGWAIFFGAVVLAELILLIIAPAMGWWLPANVSTFGPEVDRLFYVILGFTGFFFILTEAILVYNMFAFTYREGHKSQYVEGNNRLELAWTIVPAAILLYIAFVQIETWAEIKYQTRTPNPDQIVQVTARQWEWRMRYFTDKDKSGTFVNRPVMMTPENEVRLKDDQPEFNSLRANIWAETPNIDDYHGTNELHTWKGAKIKIYLKTVDVIHSFFLPQMRLKQDALPGKTIPMWFSATDYNVDDYLPSKDGKPGKIVLIANKEWEITCAELCGGFHYRMRGLLYVHKDRAAYEAWLADVQNLQQSRGTNESTK